MWQYLPPFKTHTNNIKGKKKKWSKKWPQKGNLQSTTGCAKTELQLRSTSLLTPDGDNDPAQLP